MRPSARGDRFRSILYPDLGHTYTPEMRAEMLAWFDRWLQPGRAVDGQGTSPRVSPNRAR